MPYITCHFAFIYLIFKNVYFYVFIWLHWVLVAALWIFSRGTGMVNCVTPGIEPTPSTLGAWSLSLWTTREIPTYHSKKCFLVYSHIYATVTII